MPFICQIAVWYWQMLLEGIQVFSVMPTRLSKCAAVALCREWQCVSFCSYRTSRGRNKLTLDSNPCCSVSSNTSNSDNLCPKCCCFGSNYGCLYPLLHLGALVQLIAFPLVLAHLQGISDISISELLFLHECKLYAWGETCGSGEPVTHFSSGSFTFIGLVWLQHNASLSRTHYSYNCRSFPETFQS